MKLQLLLLFAFPSWSDIKQWIDNIINTILLLLPDSPFTFIEMPAEVSDGFAAVNWFIPINTFVAILENWLIAVALWYMYAAYLRWVKVTE